MALGRFASEIDEMPSSEFNHWMAFYGLEPFGVERDNYHAGVVASTMANIYSKKTFHPHDFMLKGFEDKREKDAMNLLAGLRTYAKRSS